MNSRDRRGPGKTLLLLAAAVVMLGSSPSASAQDKTPSAPMDGWVMSAGLFAEPAFLRKVGDTSDGAFKDDGTRRDGPYAEFGKMITGAGWISAGPGYRRHVLGGRAIADASAAISWKRYKVAQGRLEFPRIAHDRLSLGAQVIYQDLLQVNYFGRGAESVKSDRSGYRLKNTDVAGYGTVRTTTWLSMSGRVGWIHQSDLSRMAGPHVTFPNTVDLFSEVSAPGISASPSFLHADVSVAADWRDYPGHPTRGGLYRASAASYSARDAGRNSFRRYEIEASQFVPLFTRKWILAVHGWEVFSDTSSGHVVPFYLMPSLGGQNTLRGYFDYRFHDNDMQSFTAESRWALFAHVDTVAFADAGKVAPRAGDLDFTHLKTSYGAGLRLHNATSTLARLDIGHSREGWHVFFKMTDSFRRSAPASGRSAIVPFVP